jgi:hypothetical protein
MSKRRQPAPDKPAEGDEPRAPMPLGEVATKAFLLALLQVKDDGGDDNAVYEAMALLCLETLAMLEGQDPAGFEHLLVGLGVYAKMRSVECMHAAITGQRPSPIDQFLRPSTAH